jgi:hypothetical protein
MRAVGILAGVRGSCTPEILKAATVYQAVMMKGLQTG